MITHDQAGEILRLAGAWVTAADGSAFNEAHGEDVDPATAREPEHELRRYLAALVTPDTYDADYLRERVTAINASAHGGPTFKWDTPIDPVAIQRMADELNAKPPEWWQEVARQIEARAKESRPWDLARAFGVTLASQETDDQPKDDHHDEHQQRQERPEQADWHGGH